MKWTSLLIVFGFLWWSWAKISEPSAVPFATHAALQRELRLWLEQKIKEQNPNLQSFVIKNIWTKNSGSNPQGSHQVEATLEYSFTVTGDSGPVEQAGELKIRLESQAQLQSANEPEKWLVKAHEVGRQSISFSEAEVVSLSRPEESQ
ncbi:MAG: hypothetical protein N2Z70_00215 [Bdellovibrionaceae bacterium]|jgi:hypothetical protein|nr:hypothetical protein [Pseudobdellovibrionaceae bacterium]